MGHDPLRDVEDAPLFIVPRVMEGLRAVRPALDGAAAAEFERLRARLLEGIEAHPTRFWVMRQVEKSLEAVDAESRTQFKAAVEELLAVL